MKNFMLFVAKTVVVAFVSIVAYVATVELLIERMVDKMPSITKKMYKSMKEIEEEL